MNKKKMKINPNNSQMYQKRTKIIINKKDLTQNNNKIKIY
jgi:hypothetical protein